MNGYVVSVCFIIKIVFSLRKVEFNPTAPNKKHLSSPPHIQVMIRTLTELETNYILLRTHMCFLLSVKTIKKYL